MTNNNNNNPFQDFSDDLGLNSGQTNNKVNDIHSLLIQLLNRVDYFREQGDVDKYQQAGSIERYIAALSPLQARNFIAAIENAGAAEQSRRGVIGRREQGESTEDYRARMVGINAEAKQVAELLRGLALRLQQPLSVLSAHAADDSSIAQYQNAQASLYRFRGYAANIEFGGRNEFYDAEINPHKTELRLNRARLIGGKFSNAASDDAEERFKAQREREAVREQNAEKRKEAENLLEQIMNNEELKEKNPAMYQQRVSAAMSLLGELNTGDKLFTQRIDPFVQGQLDTYRDKVQGNTIKRGLGMEIDKVQIQQQGDELKKLAEDVFSGRVGIYEDKNGKEDAAARQQAVQQILNLMRTNNNMLDKQTSMLEKGFGVFTKALAALGVSQAVQRVFMSDPYQYTFQPAMGMLGSMGGMGSIVGSALSAQGAYDYGINSQAMSTGMGLVGGGALTRMLFSGGAARWGALGMGALGAGMIGMGVTGHADDVFKGFSKLLGKDVDQLAYQSSLGKSLMNPQALMSLYQNTLPTSTMWGLGNINSGGSALGFLNNGNVRQYGRGNTILDSVLGGSYNGISLQQLSNPTTEALNQAIQAVGSATGRTGATGLGQLSTAAMIKAVVNGTSVENYAGMMSTARGFGSRNLMQDVNYTEALVNNKDVNKTFASEVLVPALMKVTGSLTLRNISANGSELNKMVANYYRTITSGDSNFGKLAKENPELIGKFIETIESSIKSGETNPAVMQTLMRYKIQPFEIPGVMNNPEIMQRFLTGLQGDMKAYGANNFDPKTGLPKDNRTMALMNSIGGLVNLSPENMRMIMQVVGTSGKVGEVSTADAKKLIERLNKQNQEDAKKISVDDLNKVLKNYNESTSSVTRVMQGFTKDVLDMQSWLARYINSDSFKSAAATGLQTLMDELKKVLGIKTETPGQGSTPGTSTSPSGGTNNVAATTGFADSVLGPGANPSRIPGAEKLSPLMLPDNLRDSLNLQSSVDVLKQRAGSISGSMPPEVRQALMTAINKKDGKAAADILQKWGGGWWNAFKNSQPYSLMRHVGGISATGDVDDGKSLSTASELLKIVGNAEEYGISLGDANESSMKTAGGDLNFRSNAYNMRGNKPSANVRDMYKNSLDKTTQRMLMGKLGINDIAGKLLTGDSLKKVNSFNDPNFIVNKLNELNDALKTLPKDSVDYLKVQRTIESLKQIQASYSKAGTNQLMVSKSAKAKVNLEANRFANLAMTLGQGYIDPYAVYTGSDNKLYGGIGGSSMITQDQFKKGYSVGGWTGAGMKHEPAGVVHRGEVVIPSERIKGNEKVINSLLSGEQFNRPDKEDMLYNDGESVRLVMDVSGYTPAQLKQLIQSEIAGFAKDTKILYK